MGRRGAVGAGLCLTMALAGCGGSAKSGSAHPAAGSPAALLARARTVMASLSSYSFTISTTEDAGAQPSGPTTLTGQGRVSRPGRLIATFVSGGSTIGVLETGSGRYVQAPGQAWHADPSLDVHPVDWRSLLGGVTSVHVSHGPGNAAVLAGQLGTAGVAALGLPGARVGAGTIQLGLDAGDHITTLLAKARGQRASGSGTSSTTAAQGRSAAPGVVMITEHLSLSSFDTTPAVPATPPGQPAPPH